MAKANYPTKFETFNTYVLTAVPYLDSNKARLNVSNDNMDGLNDLFSDTTGGTGWVEVYPLTTNRATSTGALRDRRDVLRKEIKDKLREIYDDVPMSALTETDRNTLRIFKRDTKPTKRGKITSAPDAAFTPLEGGEIRQRLRVDDDATRASIHPLADGWERVSKIGGTPPADVSECPLKVSGTGALSTFDAGQENDGKRLYSFIRWINLSNAANNSPWSSMEVVTISAGTVSTE